MCIWASDNFGTAVDLAKMRCVRRIVTGEAEEEGNQQVSTICIEHLNGVLSPPPGQLHTVVLWRHEF